MPGGGAPADGGFKYQVALSSSPAFTAAAAPAGDDIQPHGGMDAVVRIDPSVTQAGAPLALLW